MQGARSADCASDNRRRSEKNPAAALRADRTSQRASVVAMRGSGINSARNNYDASTSRRRAPIADRETGSTVGIDIDQMSISPMRLSLVLNQAGNRLAGA